MGGGDYRPNYVFRQVAIRGNVIRHVDNAVDAPEQTVGIYCDSGGAVLIDDNVIALRHTTPVKFVHSGMVNSVNNQTPEGTLLQAYEYVETQRFTDTYFPAAEDAFILAL